MTDPDTEKITNNIMSFLGFHSARVTALYVIFMLVAYKFAGNNEQRMHEYFINISFGWLWLLSLLAIIVGDVAEKTIGAIGITFVSIGISVCCLLKFRELYPPTRPSAEVMMEELRRDNDLLMPHNAKNQEVS